MAPERTNGINVNQLKNVPNIITSISNAPSPFPSSTTQSLNPPPVPPRQPVQNYSGFNDNRPFGSNYCGGYGFGYSNQYRGFNGYGGFSSYGPYSNYNYGIIGGHSGDTENRFFQYVEESTRPTFQLIETILQTFSSMTMLLESTYFALTNSFRAILSVAESVGKLRSTINQLFSTFALIRFLKWLYRKIINTIGFENQNSINEELWDKSLAKVGKKDTKEWHQSEEPTYIATVLYDFIATNNDELSVKAGQKVYLAPRSLQPKNLPGWCKATNSVNVGLIPYNYLKVIGQLKKIKKNNEIIPLNEEKPSTSENPNNNKKDSETIRSENET
ncbi:Peroxisomal membrane protein PEX13 [Eufriesea mexicana]|uniref:Peroxisomal membrane protein PEX13 n=1 Tax=Eufriesea mexicana TaxID=516756 RepID=A0A310SQ51_9HYME|nr:Peroxisomal membrane protein PEX13 [Eufriesea mexicana]